MIDKIRKGLLDAADTIREQAAQFGEGTKEKAFQIIEDWLEIFPRLELYGLEISSFSLSLALSPSVEAELFGKHEDFKPERLDELIAENKGHTSMLMVLNTIKTAYALHRKSLATLREPLVLKIRISITPEVQVIIGQPRVEI